MRRVVAADGLPAQRPASSRAGRTIGTSRHGPVSRAHQQLAVCVARHLRDSYSAGGTSQTTRASPTVPESRTPSPADRTGEE